MSKPENLPQDCPGRHSAFQSLLLHLGPGAVALVTYLFVCAPLSAALRLPPKMGFVLMDVLFLIPLLLGPLIYLGWRKNGRLVLDGIVLNRRSLPAKELATVLFILFAWAALVALSLSWTDAMLLRRVFYGIPGSLLDVEKVDLAGYTPGILIGTRVAGVIFVGLVGPIAEELYFRGFLLPRVSWMGVWAPVWQSALFAGYHFLSPWRFITRMLTLIPMVYAVLRKKSISIGIWGHCIGNTIGELLALATVLQAIWNRGGAA